jgi:hypothetical protein
MGQSFRERIGGLVAGRAGQVDDADPRVDERLRGLEQRVGHLEALVEGLQDAVHRDAVRHEERISELQKKTEPETLAKALSEDARRRGLI